MTVLKLILEVHTVQLSVLESEPPKLRIVASGTVPSTGWTQPQLIPFVYIQPPIDGIYDFSFVAQEPKGTVPQVITPITADYLLDPIPDALKGVRVNASLNSKVIRLKPQDGASTLCLKGVLTDEGIECQAFRSVSDELFTLIGDLKGYKTGDKVVVCGVVADFSFCMQGTTLIMNWIGDAPLKG